MKELFPERDIGFVNPYPRYSSPSFGEVKSIFNEKPDFSDFIPLDIDELDDVGLSFSNTEKH